jgi:hypothetical protein
MFFRRREAGKGDCEKVMSRDCAHENTQLSKSLQLCGEVCVKILDGTIVELETVNAISSKDVRVGDAISFRVACPVIAEGVTVISQGTVAMGVITEAARCGRYGQPGKIAWSVKEVIAVDGSSVPLQLSVILRGSEDTGMDDREMAAASLMFPAAPLALLFLHRHVGENAVILSGERFRASVQRDIEVRVPPNKEKEFKLLK